ncbi:hypothetical protein [Sphingobium sp.]|uniref:hypothetical protein n=1 Tax=Sphingobium sp. TaxID=1912891 RepID=UPI0035C7578F
MFDAVVTETDERAAKVQICDQPVLTRLTRQGLTPGNLVRIRLTGMDGERPTLSFDI